VKKPSPDCSKLLFEMPSIVMLIVFCGRPLIVDERALRRRRLVVTPGMKIRKFSAVRSLRQRLNEVRADRRRDRWRLRADQVRASRDRDDF
jgi:hypothetical protein